MRSISANDSRDPTWPRWRHTVFTWLCGSETDARGRQSDSPRHDEPAREPRSRPPDTQQRPARRSDASVFGPVLWERCMHTQPALESDPRCGHGPFRECSARQDASPWRSGPAGNHSSNRSLSPGTPCRSQSPARTGQQNNNKTVPNIMVRKPVI